MTPICFLSDFGIVDEFVGVVHGVIHRIAEDVKVIDVTHQIPRGDVRAGALALLRAIQYMPQGVALAVVDPDVGTERRAIAASTPWGYFVGPDNGLMAPAVAMVGGAEQVVSIEDPRFHLPREGATFDGRDVFAPAAAVLASGQAKLEDLGPSVPPATVTPLLFPLAEAGDGTVQGEVWWIDGFGNAQTNVSPQELGAIGVDSGDTVVLQVGAATHELPWQQAYGAVEPGDGLLHIDSYGLIAIAVRQGRADEEYDLAAGTAVVFRAVPKVAE
ncbi:MAG: S-adenosyl-l-methionine hydroxide adenosyltransferase family protein [Acidimicrobiia bacterium]